MGFRYVVLLSIEWVDERERRNPGKIFGVSRHQRLLVKESSCRYQSVSERHFPLLSKESSLIDDRSIHRENCNDFKKTFVELTFSFGKPMIPKHFNITNRRHSELILYDEPLNVTLLRLSRINDDIAVDEH